MDTAEGASERVRVRVEAGAGAYGIAEAGAGLAALVGAGVVKGPLLLVPMPSARRAVAARGHDPMVRIARAAARELRRQGVPARALPVLRQQRPVLDQAGLSAVQRRVNMAGALRVARGAERVLAGGSVVLVDDLMTTGASLAEAARVVRGVVGSPGAEAGVVLAASPGVREGGRRCAGLPAELARGAREGGAGETAGDEEYETAPGGACRRCGARVGRGACGAGGGAGAGAGSAVCCVGVRAGAGGVACGGGAGSVVGGLVGAAVIAASESAFGANRN
ncbi:ComF family protein [Streptomyces sp. 796.1]|uniref:ComF family protein n=1 Tax=Streptomyces sp. 796.1 TaxID=3163029 RepID=UPI0039C93BC4